MENLLIAMTEGREPKDIKPLPGLCAPFDHIFFHF